MSDDKRRLVEKRLGTALAKKATPDLVNLLNRELRRGARPRTRRLFPAVEHRAYSYGTSRPMSLEVSLPGVGASARWADTPPSVVVQIEGDAWRLDAPSGAQASREHRVLRLRSRAEQFRLTAQEAIGAADEAGMHPPVVGWASGSIYVTPTLEGLATLATVENTGSVGLESQIETVRSSASRSRRTSGFFLDGRVDGASGDGVRVAIVDGEPGPHDWLPALEAPKNYTREELGAANVHATMVAGLIGANSPTYRGVAADASLAGYKIVANDALRNGGESQIVDAVQTAGLDGMDVINCSFSVASGSTGAQRLEGLIATLIDDGVVVVRSAGNTASREFSAPSNAAGLMIVGACDPKGTVMAGYSNGGNAIGHAGFLVAPGGVDGAPMSGIAAPAPRLMNDKGTSFAAAIVSGLAACVLQRTPGASAREVHEHLVGLGSAPLGAVLRM